ATLTMRTEFLTRRWRCPNGHAQAPPQEKRITNFVPTSTLDWPGRLVRHHPRPGVGPGEGVTAALSPSAILLLAVTATGAAQPKAPDGFRGEVHVEPRRIGDFLIQLDSVPDKKDPRYALCRVLVFSSHGPVFQATESAMSMDEISGKDINGDGQPEAVFVGHS